MRANVNHLVPFDGGRRALASIGIHHAMKMYRGVAVVVGTGDVDVFWHWCINTPPTFATRTRDARIRFALGYEGKHIKPLITP